MSKEKNLSPLELKHIKQYMENPNRPSIQELAVETGHDVPVLKKYIEVLGGLKQEEEIPSNRTELTPEQKTVREAFAAGKGAISMTEGASTLIEEFSGNKSAGKPAQPKGGRSEKSERSIFRGNKPVNGKGDPSGGRY